LLLPLLERLTVAARADRLEEAIKLELVFLRKELSTVTSPTNTISFRNLRTDAISSRLLGQTLGKTIPISFQLTEIAFLMLCQLLSLVMSMLRLKSKSRHALK
jgi:hypothetical protein